MPVAAPLRVLVVDDTPEVRALLRLALDGSTSFQVVADAGDGLQAVAQAGAFQPDVVLLDLAMPVMDGLEAIPLIRQCSPRSRIIVLSGFNAGPMAPIALESGADAYLEKRYGPDELVRQIFDLCVPMRRGEEPAGGEAPAPEGTVPIVPAPIAVEDDVRRGRARFRLAFDQAPIGMALVDSTGRLLMANDALAAITLYERTSLLRMNLRDLFPEEASAPGRAGSTVELTCQRADGSTGWALVSRSQPWGPDGDEREQVVHVVDVTAAKGAELELRRFAAVVEHALDGIARIDRDGRFADVNPAFARMAGREPEALIGAHWATAIHPDDREAVAELEGSLQAAPRGTVEVRGRRLDGSTYAMEVQVIRAPDGDGQGGSRYWFVRDTSEREQAAQELRRTAEELARSNADLVDFAAVTAHDLRSPLQVISGFADLLADVYGARLDEAGRDYLGLVRRGARNMAELIDDLLGYARVGAATIEPVPVDLGAVLRATLDNLNIGAEGGTVTCRVSLPVVMGDPGQLALVFQNLIGNGRKFVAPGVEPRITVGAEPAPGGWTITVDDNGIGIPPADRERVFAMFERLGSRERFEGTGVGLAICRRVVERFGGRIWATDAPGGRGARFRFTLLSPPEGLPVAADPGRGEPVEDPEILLVEDSDGDAEMVVATLAMSSAAGHRVLRVRSLIEARSALSHQSLACIVLDPGLPDGDGLDSLAELRVSAPSLPIVMLTSRDDRALALAAVQRGAQDYLVKSRLDPETLARSVRYAIERVRLDADLARRALHDPLTGLPNRALTLDRLAIALARMRRTNETVGVLYVDLDGFKEINDRLGHGAGDRVLIEAGRRLGRIVRTQDTAGRIGGDEFLIVCDGVRGGDEEVAGIGRRVVEAFELPFDLIEGEARVGASVGYATAESSTEPPEAIVRRADAAMYSRKRQAS